MKKIFTFVRQKKMIEKSLKIVFNLSLIAVIVIESIFLKMISQ